MTVAMLPHILLDDRGIAWIEGTNTKVVEIILDKLACEVKGQRIDMA